MNMRREEHAGFRTIRMTLSPAILVAALSLTACNKSSPPPQKPLTPRGIAQVEIPLRLPTP